MNDKAIEAAAKAIAWSRAKRQFSKLVKDGTIKDVQATLADLHDAKAALTAAMPHLQGWQPIETAPKDGTHFIGVVAGRHPITGQHFTPDIALWHEVHGWIGPDDDELGMGGWGLTHWMPLPAPPEPSK